TRKPSGGARSKPRSPPEPIKIGLYETRGSSVERCINKIKQWRGLATRYDKNATIYLAGLYLAAIHIWSAR
ncbi:hypothetical protein ACIPQI_39285, partial [Streptomyces sp. NPDC090112]